MELPKVNFSWEETQNLKVLVEYNKYVLFNKKVTAATSKLKEETWKAIAEEFNACSPNYRTVKQLKYKFENMKQIAKREFNRSQLSNDNGNKYDATTNDFLGNSVSSDSEWLRGLMNMSMGENVSEIQPEMVNNNMEPGEPELGRYLQENDKDENSSPPKMRKKLRVMSEKKQRFLYNKEQVMKRENVMLLSHLEDLHKQKMAQKTERHLAQIEHEKRINDALISKLSLESQLSEAHLNKVALETRQLEAQQIRDDELHAMRMLREDELHKARLAREAEMHQALLAREMGHHINRL